MTKDEAKTLAQEYRAIAEAAEAFADGKAVQFHNASENRWVNAPDPSLSPDREWRVKPEPRHIWLLLNKEGTAIRAGFSSNPNDQEYTEFVEKV